jgi:hypothetical protein
MSRWLSLRSLLIIILLLFTTDRLPAPVSELRESPKLKRTFFMLKGHAVNIFANEKGLPPELDPAFGGAVHVLATRPLVELTELMKRFGRVSPYAGEFLNAGFGGEDMTPEMQRREAAIKRIEKSQLKKLATTPSLSVATRSGARFSASKFPSDFFADHAWSIEGYQLDEHLTKAVKRPSRARMEVPLSFGSSITVSRYLARADIDTMRRADPDMFKYRNNLQFYADVCRAGLPEHLLPVTVMFDECGGSTEVDIETPLLQMRILVLENITNKPVELGQFHFRLVNPGRGVLAVRTRAENERLLASAAADSQSWYQPHVLKPGEKVIVPLELLLKPDSSNRPEASVASTRATRRACANRLLADRELQTVAIMYEGKGPQRTTPLMTMPKQKFIDALLRESIQAWEGEEFIYGPSIGLDSVDVDGPKYAIEPFDPMNIAYFSGSAEGSCPFLYCRRARDGRWLKEGTILTGRSSKERAGTTTLEVRNFDGVVRVSEEEEETSYVDQLFIRGVSSTGETVIVTPANDLLTDKDHRYLILKRGETTEVNFRIPEDMRRDRVGIIASGYFVPTSVKKSR